jgi:beta-lactamase class A
MRLVASVRSAASPEACTTLRSVMSQQVTRRLAPAILDGGTLEAKSGGLFRRIRNEIALITDPGGEAYSVAVLTRSFQLIGSPYIIDNAMAQAVTEALDKLRT